MVEIPFIKLALFSLDGIVRLIKSIARNEGYDEPEFL